MTTQSEASRKFRIDWPLIGFFALAYALARGSLGILGWIAQQSSVDSSVTLMRMGR